MKSSRNELLLYILNSILMKKYALKITSVFLGLLIGCSLLFLNACEKDKNSASPAIASEQPSATISAIQNEPITQVLSVLNIQKLDDGTYKVVFNKNAEVFTVSDPFLLSELQTALSTNRKLKITFNPWQALITNVEKLTQNEILLYDGKNVKNTGGTAIKINANEPFENLDTDARLSVVNTTSPGTGLVNVVPDMATAQLMFNYLTKQCCALPGPYGVDYCISFQYADDGCYARAHKMCYVLNNKYHYATHKIFSFANAGSDVLSVQAQKWGGCCVNWWYHVAPLVSVKTPTGVKSFVFDPAMFDQPVLLSVWLHAQENPVCVSWGTGNVSMINIQPTTSYAPADYSGFAFDPDPFYVDTNNTLVSYSNLLTCP